MVPECAQKGVTIVINAAVLLCQIEVSSSSIQCTRKATSGGRIGDANSTPSITTTHFPHEIYYCEDEDICCASVTGCCDNRKPNTTFYGDSWFVWLGIAVGIMVVIFISWTVVSKFLLKRGQQGGPDTNSDAMFQRSRPRNRNNINIALNNLVRSQPPPYSGYQPPPYSTTNFIPAYMGPPPPYPETKVDTPGMPGLYHGGYRGIGVHGSVVGNGGGGGFGPLQPGYQAPAHAANGMPDVQ